MKILRKLPLFPFIGASVVLSSCSTLDNVINTAKNKLNQPINDTSYNPLDKPGTVSRKSNVSYNNGGMVKTNEHGFHNGDIVEVVIPNTALFAKVPKSGDRYKKVLQVGESLRVIGGEKDFIKVVTEKGDTGFVSSVMVVAKGSLTNSAPAESTVKPVSKNETPIVPDVAPDPVVKGIGTPDPVAPDPGLTVPDPGLTIPDPGLTVPDPAPVVPTIEVPTIPEVPLVPDPVPVVPSLPDVPAPEPVSPGLPE